MPEEQSEALEIATVKLTPEDETTGKIKARDDKTKAKLGTDFVPNLSKAMASNLES